MKKLCILFAMLVSAALSYAENHRIYAIFVCDPKMAPVVIRNTSDSGSALSGFNFKENFLRDENGKELKFNNFLPAIAYMEKDGWVFPDLEDQIRKNMQNIVSGNTSFLMYKEASEAEWLNWIEEGKKKK